MELAANSSDEGGMKLVDIDLDDALRVALRTETARSRLQELERSGRRGEMRRVFRWAAWKAWDWAQDLAMEADREIRWTLGGKALSGLSEDGIIKALERRAVEI